ncbi:MAG: TRAP transporter large permease [Betaproteobacteria bacterium]|nr:MAG: TRAP transporter large permease [Betaproteobacteria bacterium]
MTLIILAVTFVIMLIIGVPIAFAVGISALITVAYEGIPAAVVFQRMTSGMNVFAFLAVPFFIFAGELMFYGGIGERLVRFASALVGRVRGGLGMANVTASMLFGGISGSAVADVSALGSVMMPMMKEKGYDDDYTVNLTTHAALIGILIPPSHNMIIYSLAAGGSISVSALFLAGVLPGLLMGVALMACAYIIAVKRGYPAEAWAGWREVWRTFCRAFPGLFAAVIIIVGILSGVFTVTESAAIGTIYALVVTVFVYRSLDVKRFWMAAVSATKTTALVMLLIGTSAAFDYLMALNQVPTKMADWMGGVSQSPWVVFLLINLILIVLGTFMDMAGTILICTPIFLPIAQKYGMDPVQFGMVLMLNCAIGLNTPPVGTVQYVGCSIAKVPIDSVMKTIWPWYLTLFVTLLLLTYIPALSLWLPRVFLGYGA